MRTNENGGNATPSIEARIKELNRIDKPAGRKWLRLQHTLETKKTPMSFDGTEFFFQVPAWIEERLDRLWTGQLVWDWVRNSRWLYDPEHGEFTRERYLRKWEDALKVKETWINRDKEPTLKMALHFRNVIAEQIEVLAEFLQISREVLLVGILASEALKRTKDDGPVWDDFQLLQAGQEKITSAERDDAA